VLPADNRLTKTAQCRGCCLLFGIYLATDRDRNRESMGSTVDQTLFMPGAPLVLEDGACGDIEMSPANAPHGAFLGECRMASHGLPVDRLPPAVVRKPELQRVLGDETGLVGGTSVHGADPHRPIGSKQTRELRTITMEGTAEMVVMNSVGE
jgi:hypothetical protein